LLPLVWVREGKETAGMGFHLLVLTICELEGSPAYCFTQLCRGLASAQARHTQWEVLLSVSRFSHPYTSAHQRKGILLYYFILPRVSPLHRLGVCVV